MTMQGSARLPELAAPHDYVFHYLLYSRLSAVKLELSVGASVLRR